MTPPKSFCQSCSMPIDDVNMRGTEKDGSKNPKYCMYCYKDGALIDPNMTLDQMRMIVKTEMEKKSMQKEIIDASMAMLPHLERWKSYAK